MNRPLVTVCVPTYNKASLLSQSLRSILAQTFSDFKLIVVDDHSIDGTREVVAALKDSRIQYINNEENLGLCGNWNRCLEFALEQGTPYIAIYHDDDYYVSSILEREVNFLEAHSEVGLVHTAQFYYNETEQRYSLRRPYAQDRIITELELLYDLCLRGIYHITTPSVLARRDAYIKSGRFDPSFKICPDLDLWWRMLEHYDMGYIATPLFTQRIHKDQLSSSGPALTHAITQEESRMVLERALGRLGSRYGELIIDRYRPSVSEYFAKQILKAAAVELLDGNKIELKKVYSNALGLSPTLRIRTLCALLRLLQSSIGRQAASVAHKVVRRLAYWIQLRGATRC